MEPSGDRLFRRALEAAAKALRDLDADQVPADLLRVRGRPLPLPPPLAVSLLKALDRYDWLREKALEAWPEADSATAGPERASALVLQRPSGWVARLAAAASELARREGREALAAQKWGRGWIGVALPILFLAAQHCALPLVFSGRFLLWRLGMFLPFAD